tara:strand:- start:1132 stop:2892 length:1761 start_codon:yes stop_codon:yes gene_type:complete
MILNEDKKDIDPTPLKIFIGWDSREDIAYQVCKQSILNHASVPVDIIPLKLKQLRRDGIYTRPADNLASTEFTFTRFLIPELCEFNGWALFIDCDFIFLEDIKNLFDQVNNEYAVMCAHHDYTPKPGIKMDGQQQHIYPRKNWSSCVLFNCSHPSNKICTSDWLNNITKNGAFFHRFSWLKNKEIGKISHEWNWLVGWYKEPKDGNPKALHYTEGGPWFSEYYNCEYASEFYHVERNYLDKRISSQAQKIEVFRRRPQTIENLTIPLSLKKSIKAFVSATIDPNGSYYGYSEEEAMKIIQNKFQKGKSTKVAAIFNDDLDYKMKSYVYDEYLEAFSLGVGGKLSTWEKEENTDYPLVVRGVGGSSRKAIQHCWNTGREFYAIDTGYFGNSKSKSKGWHRITKNALQYTGPIIERPDDRVNRFRYKIFKPGRKIMIVPPSDKVMRLFGQPDSEIWVKQVKLELEKYTDRPIEIRLKPCRRDRISINTLESALADEVHCLVTYNSIAALEALLLGVPAITLGPNCASVLCNTQLSDIENLNIPTADELYTLMTHLSYCQFTREEMMNGYAWDILNDREATNMAVSRIY